MITVALLRAVNLPGHQPLSMANLRAFCDALGCTDVNTLLQSGNVVFRTARRSTVELERRLEQEARKRLSLPIEFFVRTAAEWQAIIEHNPFPKEAKADPSHLLVMCFKDALEAKAVTALQDAIAGREQVRAHGRQAYFVYPDGIGRSRVTNALIERKLGTRGTGRNWNTVLKIQTLLT